MTNPVYNFMLYGNQKYKNQIERLFSYNQALELFIEHQLELRGVLDMVNGLEYHYKNFRRIEKKYINAQEQFFKEHVHKSVKNSENMIHEVTAYLNRLGQIYALITSVWFKKYITKDTLVQYCPTLLALLPFRNKFAAHRSIDAPKSETESQRANHASLPFHTRSAGRIGDISNVNYQIKISKNERISPRKTLLAVHLQPVKDVEFFSENEVWINFIPTKHHAIICSEIITVIRNFLKK